MDLPMQEKLSAHFGVQKVTDLHIFNVKFEHNIENQHR